MSPVRATCAFGRSRAASLESAGWTRARRHAKVYVHYRATKKSSISGNKKVIRYLRRRWQYATRVREQKHDQASAVGTNMVHSGGRYAAAYAVLTGMVISPFAPVTFARPKSEIIALGNEPERLLPMRILSNFRSRWITFWECKWHRPAATWMDQANRWLKGTSPCWRRRAFNREPSHSSISRLEFWKVPVFWSSKLASPMAGTTNGQELKRRWREASLARSLKLWISSSWWGALASKFFKTLAANLKLLPSTT